jgi:peptide/nickel transport system permease protein
MAGYLTRRLGMLALVVLGVTVIVFAIIHIVPGDPAMVILGPLATQDDVAQLRRQLGLDDPLYVQYLRWISRVIRGDLGRSIATSVLVFPEVLAKFKATFILASAALLVSTSFGMLAGVTSAVRPRSFVDQATMVLALLGVSMPVFWLGIMLMLFFSLRLNWLPATGMYSPAGGGISDLLAHLILPAITLGAASMAIVARMTRSSMLEVLSQDYVRTARAKGLREQSVVYRHALSNALIPIVTIVGVQMGYLLGGAVLTETVFAWPGIGTLMVKAIFARDFPMVQGAVLLVALVFSLVNLIVDLSYALLDPRIRYE